MDTAVIAELLVAVRDAIITSAHRRDDDVALPLFDPEKNDSGSASWCDSIDILAEEFKWSSTKTAAKAGQALKGSALQWFETWEPLDGRSWANFRADLTDAYPDKKNLSIKLNRAVSYTSDAADSYSEYAREKIRLFRCTKVAFTEEQIIELVCGGITNVDVRMVALNNGVTNTAALISLLSTYVKAKKRSLGDNVGASPDIKRIRSNMDKKCFKCNRTGHVQAQCFRRPQAAPPAADQSGNPGDFQSKTCSFCKKIGHTELTCFLKQRTGLSKILPTKVPNNKEVSFLGHAN